TIQTTTASWPPQKQECIILCGMVLRSYPPSPNLTMRLHFGFCAGGRHSEMAIVELYKKLLQLVTFDEFHQAYGNARLVEPLERKGLTQNGAYRLVEGKFKDVVDGSKKGKLKSAWRLKEFVENNPGPLEPKQRSEIRNSINVDYGWMNCKDIQQSNKLLRIYRQYFESPAANCLDLHSACVSGTLAAYLQRCTGVNLQKEDEALFKNLYPLPSLERMPGEFDASELSGLDYSHYTAFRVAMPLLVAILAFLAGCYMQ
ncbi:hypothetical protein BKA70DRAFT_1119912, partial [Coprinopsis sp. MPI-PUGE-AT-0042]